MKRFALVLSLLLSSIASSQLMGTSKSFTSSSFCKKYECIFAGNVSNPNDPKAINKTYVLNTKEDSFLIVSQKQNIIYGSLFIFTMNDSSTEQFVEQHYQICKDLILLMTGFNLSHSQHIRMLYPKSNASESIIYKGTEIKLFASDNKLHCRLIYGVKSK